MKSFVRNILGLPSSASSRAARVHTFKPNLDPLENRLTPSATVATASNGTVLVITGDNQANQVAISINDAANQLTVVADGVTHTFTSSQIKKINVDLKDGDDGLWMGLAPGSNLQYTKTASLVTGAGDDSVSIDMWHGINNFALLQGSLDITVNTGDGADELDADFGWKHGGTLKLSANMGAGDDLANARMWGDISGGAKVTFSLAGSSGNDVLGTWNTYDNIDQSYGSIKVTSDAVFNITLNGGAGDDTMRTTYSGELDGRLNVRVYGASGNDRIWASPPETTGIRLKAGSTGVVDAIFQGNSGDDLMSVAIVQEAGSNAALVNAIMDGGDGVDGWNWVETSTNMTKVYFEFAYPRIFPPVLDVISPGVISPVNNP